MAEATVESPHLTSMFFCHECQQEVRPNIPAYTCSRCNSGFIEELERQTSAPAPRRNDSTITDPAAQFAEMLTTAFLDPLRPVAPSSNWRIRHRYNTRQASSQAANRGPEENTVDDSDEDEIFSVNTGGERTPRQQTYQGLISYVIQRLSNDLGAGRPLGIHLHSSPDDYAWGPGGLDVIISQLLSQLEGTGAPPAQRETIDNLPKVQIQQADVDAQLQCSICMEDFELGKEVHKLPCDHLYHTECIVRWLEMHGTCPVCRKDLNGEDTSRNEANFSNIYPSGSNADATPSASSSSSSMDPSASSSFSMDYD